jgi:TPR repeat protein
VIDNLSDHPVLQRERTLAIVLAASDWPFYPAFHAAKSFQRSAHAIVDYLRVREGLNLPPRNVKVLVNSFDDGPEILRQMWEFIRSRRADLTRLGAPATDLLLYYVGHGGFTDSDAFFLSIRSTNEDDPLATSISAESLGRMIREAARGLRTYLVLDCCFAASISKVFMSAGPLELAGIQLRDALPPQGDSAAATVGALPGYGTALLCASGPREPAKAPPDLAYTMFTGALLEVLQDGDPRAPPWLSLDDMQRLVRARLERRFADRAVMPQVHAPQQRMGRVDLVPLFRNLAHANPNCVSAQTSAHHQKTQADESANSSIVRRPGWKLFLFASVVLIGLGGAVWVNIPHWSSSRPPSPAAEAGNPSTGTETSAKTTAVEHPVPAVPEEALARATVAEMRKDFADAARAYKVAADQGNAFGQNNLGVFYRDGRGVTKSTTEAARLFKLSADQGNADGQSLLGSLYYDNPGMPQSNTEAVRLAKLLADQGNPLGQNLLGLLYRDGRGVPQSDTEAARLLKLSADQGNAFGQNNLGRLYRDGRGVPQSDTEAARLFKLSADQGNAFGQNNLGVFYRDGRGVTKSTTEAARLFKLSADQGNADGQSLLGSLYYDNPGMPQSR